jgi:hypothetical protein
MRQMSEQWTPAELIPTAGIKGALEQERRSTPCLMIDGRDFDDAPEHLVSALRHSGDSLRAGRRDVLMIDTYMVLDGVDGWMRDEFLPSLPADTLVVLAGREPPVIEWREDAGWRELLHVISLRNLREKAKAALLAKGRCPGGCTRVSTRSRTGTP